MEVQRNGFPGTIYWANLATFAVCEHVVGDCIRSFLSVPSCSELKTISSPRESIFMKKQFCILIILFILTSILPERIVAQFYNGYSMQFGKNRVQYEERFWSFMRFKNYDTYYYLGGLELATFTGRTAQKDLEEIEKLFDYKLDGRIQFVIYNKLGDAKQSNIGLETEEIGSNNTGGITRIVGNKVFLYFTGDHIAFHKQIRGGIARVLIDQIMYGGDIKDRLQNSALLSLPDWYINGLVSYVSSPWNTEIDNRVRDGVNSKKYLKFNHLTGIDAVYAGHSIWKFIIDTYSESSVANLLYMTRVNRNIESGLMYVLGQNIKELSFNWRESMKSRYLNSDSKRDSIESKNILKRSKPETLYSQLKTSADGRYSIYVANNLGKYKVYLYDHEKKSRKRIQKSGYRSYAHETDISFPVLAWHPTGQLFAIIRERKGKLVMGTYTLSNKEYVESPLFNFEKVLNFSYADDGQSIVMSAIQKGQSDIFVYNLRTRVAEQITKDFFDDLDPHFIDKSRAIVFSSNRVNDTLGVDKSTLMPENSNYDIFYYDYRGQSAILRRITSTMHSNELQPMQFDSSAISYLSDENGIVNRYIAHLDSALSYVDTAEHYRMIVDNAPLTNYARNIISYNVNHNYNRVSEIVFRNGKYQLYVGQPKTNLHTDNPLPKTLFKNEQERALNAPPPAPTKPNVTTIEITDNNGNTTVIPADSNVVNIDNYVFQSDFPKSKKKDKKKDSPPQSSFIVPQDSVVIKIEEAKKDSLGFQLPKQRNYETAFSSTYFVSQLDNSLLNQSYQIFNGGSAIYYNPGLNGFFKLGISDLLEDYRITGGFKLAADLNSNEYFLSYEYLKKRMDRQLTFYRQATLLPEYGAKQFSHELRYASKYPFSDVSSLRGSIAYRNDKIVTLSLNQPSLESPDVLLHWATARLEYVLDNTINMGLNLYNGTRFKIFGEYYKQVDRKESGMVIVGADFRHYLKIHRELIWANRIATSTSFGKEKLIYYLGGTDNWISPGFNYETQIDYSQNYYFQALASNLRGFDQNIRNGNTFALINSEIRWPVFKYLLNRPIKSDFVRNFQIIGFGDIGTAWNGLSPYDSTNVFNRTVISNTPFVVTVVKQNEPIVGGYGFGLRTRLLGYFIRADWAWGIENRDLQPYKFYFSFGLDF